MNDSHDSHEAVDNREEPKEDDVEGHRLAVDAVDAVDEPDVEGHTFETVDTVDYKD